MEGHPPPTDFDMIKTVAISKIIMGPSMNIQVPPNLNSKTYMLHICSGVNDLGGVSPITIDYVNPECPWPQIDLMTKDISEFGFNLIFFNKNLLMKFKIFKYKSVTSTNDVAINLIREKKINSGFVYADKQSKGKGTRGRKWISDEGNFFASLFFPLKNNKR